MTTSSSAIPHLTVRWATISCPDDDGDDRVYGASGDDSVSGGQGDDHVSGSLGSDIVDGGDGNDNVSDGPPFDTGTDIAYGGAGDDLMDAYNDPPLTDTIYCGPGDDRYTDGGTSCRLRGRSISVRSRTPGGMALDAPLRFLTTR